jgi:hypothetical protein
MRDIIIGFIPIFVLYKLSTHPMIASIGSVDPNAPQKLSSEDALANIIKNMALQKYKEKYRRRQLFLDAVDHKKCYDFSWKIKAAEDKVLQSSSMDSKSRPKFRPGYKGRNDGMKRRHDNTKQKIKKKKSFTQKKTKKVAQNSPLPAPLVSSIMSGLMLAFNPPKSTTTVKGTESNMADFSIPKKKAKKKLKMTFKF